MIPIREFCEKAGVSSRTLIRWQTKGILVPAEQNPGAPSEFGGGRWYRPEQVEEAKRLLEGHPEEITITEIAKELHIPRETVYVYEKEGVIAPIRIDGKTKVFARQVALSAVKKRREQGAR